MKISRTDALLLALPLLAAAGLSGCGDDETETETSGEQSWTINFSALVGSDAFACGQTYTGLGATNSELTPVDFRFYVHDVELLSADGSATPLALTDDAKWQSEGVALLDFEDGCGNGTTDMNAQLIGTAPKGSYTGVRFVLGVPPEMNDMAMGLEQRTSPLNLSSMFWSWSTGYKFLRLDSDGPFRFHLGSTGCADPEDPFACSSPNEPAIALDLDLETQSVAIDLAALLDSADLEVAGEPCMSQPNNEACVPIFDALGLPHGDNTGGAQSAFSAK